ncbi:MAG: hypothetical protein ACRCZ0_10450 [Cetobacterium sp.]
MKINQKNCIIHFDWLVKCLDAVIDGSAEVLLYVNENRQKILEDTINLHTTNYKSSNSIGANQNSVP